MSREVLQITLDTLERIQWKNWRTEEAIEALRAELAKPAMCVPLTDLEIQQIAIATKSAEPGRDGYILPYSFARAIEQAHNIKGNHG